MASCSWVVWTWIDPVSILWYLIDSCSRNSRHLNSFGLKNLNRSCLNPMILDWFLFAYQTIPDCCNDVCGIVISLPAACLIACLEPFHMVGALVHHGGKLFLLAYYLGGSVFQLWKLQESSQSQMWLQRIMMISRLQVEFSDYKCLLKTNKCWLPAFLYHPICPSTVFLWTCSVFELCQAQVRSELAQSHYDNPKAAIFVRF